MAKRWRIHPHDTSRVTGLERTAGISPVIAQLLICRGIDDRSRALQFLEARLSDLRPPEQLPGLLEAVDRLDRAIAAGRRITVYGDYDADGMTATAILLRCLQLIGAQVNYYVPNRLEDGYGLNSTSMRELAAAGTSLIVSVDCGIGSVAEAECARQLNLELVITDHHEMGPTLPNAAAIVHPRLPGHNYPFKDLCGAGVAFKLCWALCQRISRASRVTDRLRSYLLSALGLAAIGTVADVVPLIDENRILVRHGLSGLREHPTPGLAALMRVTQLSAKRQLTSEDIAFVLAPRLNAAGRLGQAQLGIELLTTDSAERAQQLAEYLHQLNDNRDHLERSIYHAAHKQIVDRFDPQNDAALVLADRGWHPGVIGIVAGRLAEKYHRPVVMISLDEMGKKLGTGSARSACGLRLTDALAACRELLAGHGGHAAAAGLRIDAAHVDAFRRKFCEYSAAVIDAEDRVAQVIIDAEAPLPQMTLRTVEQLERLAPFGNGNPRPVLCATGVQLCEPPKCLGKGDRHLATSLRQHGVTLRSIAFQRADWADELQQVQGPIDVAYRPVINLFRGRRNVELHLVDWKPSVATDSHR